VLYQKRLLPAIALVLGCLGSGALGTDQKDNETVSVHGFEEKKHPYTKLSIWKPVMCLLLQPCEFVSKIVQLQFSTWRVWNSFCPICSNCK
jgi:hypothetical protein